MATITDNSGENINKRLIYEEELPRELWVEIFLRSSVESLCRIKCVCTRWCALVNNPSFTKKHLQFQRAVTKNKGRLLLKHCEESWVTHSRPPWSMGYVSFDEESVPNAAKSSLSDSNPFESFLRQVNATSTCIETIEGPINGLYCVYNGIDRIVIWNPATKDVGFLPFPDEYLPSGYESDDSSSVRIITCGNIGFGIDPLNEEDFKVVLMCHYDSEYDYLGFCRMLYTTYTNTWRLIEDNLFRGQDCPNYITSNGINYWLENHGMGMREVALAFYMSKESFKEIPTPCIASEFSCCDLVVHNDDVTLFIVNKDLCKIDIWVLMVEESIWIKKNTISGIRGVEKSLGFWKKEDELLLVIADSPHLRSEGRHQQFMGQTVCYNTTSREMTYFGPKGLVNLFETIVYYESLAFLGGEITKCKVDHAMICNFLSTDEQNTSVESD